MTLGVAAACSVIAIRRMSWMGAGVSTRLGSFGSFTVVWLVMTAAMMLPGALVGSRADPADVTPHRHAGPASLP